MLDFLHLWQQYPPNLFELCSAKLQAGCLHRGPETFRTATHTLVAGPVTQLHILDALWNIASLQVLACLRDFRCASTWDRPCNCLSLPSAHRIRHDNRFAQERLLGHHDPPACWQPLTSRLPRALGGRTMQPNRLVKQVQEFHCGAGLQMLNLAALRRGALPVCWAVCANH